MKTINFLLPLNIFILLLFLVSCSNDENNFGVESTYVEIHVGERKTLKLKNANGECNAQVESPDIMEATIYTGEVELFSKDEGTTIVRVTDQRNTSIEIRATATLNLRGIWKPQTYTYDIQTSDDSSAGIRYLLEKNPPYDTQMQYVFTPDGKTEDITPGITAISYQFKNGLLTGTASGSDKIYIYRIRQWTEEKIILTEDLTEYFRTLYPDAKIDYVKRNIQWKRYLSASLNRTH